jgi:uncharacterized protein (TIGR02996 family)
VASESQVFLDRALAAALNPAWATRGLFRDLFEVHAQTPLPAPLRAMLSALAERATSVQMATPPVSGAAAEELGDNWFQCPHCAEVFEGKARKCASCGKWLAVARPALEIVFGDARMWLRASPTLKRKPLTDLRYLETAFDWLRVEHGERWFELFDDGGRETAATTLKVAVPPNVSPIGAREDGSVILAHETKLEVHVAKAGALHADPRRLTCAPELVVRQLAAVLYPDDVLPAAPSTAEIASRGHARDPKLEDAIAADLDAPEAYLVYADWLQAQGDPRGELVVLQHAKKPLAGAELVERHKEHFFGPLANAQRMLSRFPFDPLGRDTTWRWGYLEALWIGRKDEKEKPNVDEALLLFLDHPTCRFLRHLTVGIVTYEENGYDEVAKAIGAQLRPTLESVILGDFFSDETELNWSHMGDVSPMYAAVPNLRSLTLRSGSMHLGTIDLPKLEELVIITGGFDGGSLASICNARWPMLHTLSIQLGSEHTFEHAELAPIFEAAVFSRVTTLGLGNANGTDDLCRWLVESKIAEQLEVLDLSKGTMGDEGARALASGRFPRLKTLDVSENWITEEGLAVLANVAPEVHSAGQRDDDGDPEDRYIAARE